MSPRSTGFPAVLAVLLVVAPIALYAYQSRTAPIPWDAMTLRVAVQTLHEGDNPYSVEELRKRHPAWLSCTFQPLVLRLGTPLLLLPMESLRWLVLALSAGALLAALPLVEPRERFFALALFGSGFAGWSSILVTGNLVTLVEFLAVLLLLHAAARGSTTVPFLSIALLAFLKLTPAVLALPLAWWAWQCRAHRDLARALAWSAALFLGLNLLSAASSGGHYLDFYRSAFGLIPGQHSPIHETHSGSADPSPLLLVADCFRFGGPVGGLASLAALFALAWWVRGCLQKRFLAAPAGLPFLLLFSTVVLPRIKPYFFLPIACLFFSCAREFDARGRILAVLVFGALPLLLHAIVGIGPAAAEFGRVVAQNYQTLLLLVAIGVLYPALRARSIADLDDITSTSRSTRE